MTKPAKWTLAQAKAEMRALGLTLTKTEVGDYRIAWVGRGNEPGASYESRWEDAFDTGLAMVKDRKRLEARAKEYEI